METPEVHAPHPHKPRPRRDREGLPRWLELSIAVTALVTSVSSIFIAVQHGRIMEKLVEANSVPYLEGGFSDITPEGDQILSLDLLNRGVGPAHEESMQVTVDGHYVRSLKGLMVASIGADNGAKAYEAFQPTLVANKVPKRFIAAGQSQFVFRLRRSADPQLWDLLARQQSRWNVAFCYCSVFDECWAVHGKMADDRPVKQCTRDEATEFMP
jgi:hypothetical protein